MLIKEDVSNLINGVSQQADALRFSSQHTEQINGLSSAINGLSKRPSCEHISSLIASSSASYENIFYHWVDRDENEKYLIAVVDGSSPTIYAWDLEGNSFPVVASGGGAPDVSYLQCSNPRTDLKAMTVGDTIFLVNTTTSTSLGSTQSTARDPEALVFIKSVRETSAQTIELINTVGSLSVSYTATVTAGSTSDQESVASGLVTALNSAGAGAEYTYSTQDGVIYIKRTDGADFSIRVNADVPGSAYSIKDTIQSFSDLPAKAYVGFTVKVQGSPDDTNSEYYVHYQGTDTALTSGFAEGSWIETVQPNLIVDIDETTMPHKLLVTGSSFVYDSISWNDREVGDDTTNPAPSFIDNKINNMFYFKNRVGFLSDENVIMSQVGEFFNFWQTTVISLLDDAVIDIAPGSANVIKLRDSVELEGELLVFADSDQFVITADGVMTPSTVQAKPVSSYDYDKYMKPLKVGSSVYYTFRRGEYSGVSEYVRIDQTQPFQSTEITRHVPRYLDGRCRTSATFSPQNMVAMVTDGYTDGFYMYIFLDQGTNRVQSSWSKFDIGGQVDSLYFFESDLYMAVRRSDNIFLEKIDTAFDAVETGLTYRILLDRRVTEAEVTSLVYDSVTDTTTFDLPYVPDSGSTIQLVTREEGATTGGVVYNNVTYAGSTVTVRGDLSSVKFYAGQSFDLEVTLTRPVLKQRTQSSSGGVIHSPVNNARGMLRYLYVNYNDTKSFSVDIQAKAKDTLSYTCDATDIGTLYDIVGDSSELGDGVFQIPVFEDVKYTTAVIKNSTPLPCNILSLTWEIYVASRTR